MWKRVSFEGDDDITLCIFYLLRKSSFIYIVDGDQGISSLVSTADAPELVGGCNIRWSVI